MPAPYDVTQEELARLLEGEPSLPGAPGLGGPPRAGAPARGDDRAAGGAPSAARPRPCRRRYREQARQSADAGQTTKWLWTLHDGARVETVLMRYPDRVTVCVSTQAGCAMACQFCATGQAGFQRHLSQGEIVEQVVVAMREAAPRRLSNVVFMGMGEPLANYDRVWGAVVRLHAEMGLSARHLTLSTVGIVPGIRRLAAESAAGQPRRVAARRQRRVARRAGADQPPLPAGRARRRLRRRTWRRAAVASPSNGRSSTA